MDKMIQFTALDLMPGGSEVTTGFGWDVGPENADPLTWPRIHHAIDRYGPGDICAPFDAGVARWIARDSLGCSVLRLMSGQAELRLVHINPPELDPDFFSLAFKMRPIPKGMRLGPCGNTGVSYGKNAGRHLHYLYMVMPGAFSQELTTLAPGWEKNDMPDLSKVHGIAFDREIDKRVIVSMNESVIRRWDPYWGREMLVLNTEKLFEGGNHGT